MNVAEILPAAIVTLEGTLASLLELLSEMEIPPDGAGPEIVTVPVEAAPPGTDAGERVRETRLGGSTVTGADAELSGSEAFTVTWV